MELNQRSLNSLKGVKPALVNVVKKAAELYKGEGFIVIEGLRTVERQRQLVAAGASKTMNSRHISGHAVDIVPVVGGTISWNHKDFAPIKEAMEAAAKALGVNVEWGGSWKTFVDMPHWQISPKDYP